MLSFFKNRKIFLTGHTGFKGAWLCKMLINLEANVTGYSLQPPTTPNLFEISGIEKHMTSFIGDIRNFRVLEKAFNKASPEIVLHMAAQPNVRESYKNPRYTFETNIMGTVNILECIRRSNFVKSALNVTTDKVYQNNEWVWGYRENDSLGGFDPYSGSKSSSELVTASYRNSFLSGRQIAVSTARAGNVIGGGDFAKDRIIPDCVRAAINKTDIIIRNPNSVRPYQHVLEPLYAYLMILQKQYEDLRFADSYNIGPEDYDYVTTGDLADLFCKKWGESLKYIIKNDDGPHEADILKLECSKMKAVFGWKPNWNVDNAVGKTVEWTKKYISNENLSDVMDKQISDFLKGKEKGFS